MKAAALRSQIEAALDARYGQPFTFQDRRVTETVSCGIAEIDAITGGLPRGGLTEIFGPASSGRTSLMISLLAKMTAAEEVCALIDAQDAFDPHSAAAAGVNLKRLLWLRCSGMEPALKVMDLLIHSGGFGLVALDVGDIAPRLVRRVPLAYWFRFQRAIEHTPTVLLLVEQEPYAQSAASLVLRLTKTAVRWAATSLEKRITQARLLEGAEINAEILRSRILMPPQSPSHASFRTQTLWSLDRNSIRLAEEQSFNSDQPDFSPHPPLRGSPSPEGEGYDDPIIKSQSALSQASNNQILRPSFSGEPPPNLILSRSGQSQPNLNSLPAGEGGRPRLCIGVRRVGGLSL